MWSRGFFASLLFHVLVAIVILVGIPLDLPKPEQEETVSVEIVPPPEEEKAKEKAPKEAPTPAPPPPQQSAKAEKPPEQAEQKPSPQAAEKVQEDAKEPPSPAPEQYRPVFQFGEKDGGPEQATQGTSATEEPETDNAASEEARKSDDSDVVNDAGGRNAADGKDEAADRTAENAQPPSAAAEGMTETEKPVDPSPPVELASPGEGAAPSISKTENAAAPRNATETASESGHKSGGGPAASQTKDGSAKPALKKAKKLFSAKANDDPMAAVALGIMSRSQRGAVLCNSELGAQLANGSPQYAASRLPMPPLTSGNVIDTQTAFSTRSQWYDVTFRCEVDKDATKVLSFAYDVGPAIPKSEWKKRRLPTPY